MSSGSDKLTETNMTEIDEETLQDLYSWIDNVPLTRPKRNFGRDFSDGVLAAEVCKHFFPKMVDLHNYTPANSTKQKTDNWNLLNRKVFVRLRFEVTDEVIKQIIACKPYVVEHVLLMLRTKINRALAKAESSDGKLSSQTSSSGPSPGTSEQRLFNGHVFEQPEVDQYQSPEYSQRIQKIQAEILSGYTTRGQHMHTDLPAAESSRKPKNKSQITASHAPTKNQAAATVPRMLLEEKEQELLSKEEVIQILQAKIRRLEHLVHLKEIRIEDLQSKLYDKTSLFKPEPPGRSNIKRPSPRRT